MTILIGHADDPDEAFTACAGRAILGLTQYGSFKTDAVTWATAQRPEDLGESVALDPDGFFAVRLGGPGDPIATLAKLTAEGDERLRRVQAYVDELIRDNP